MQGINTLKLNAPYIIVIMIFVFFRSICSVVASDCLYISRSDDFAESDYVFLGEVVEVTDDLVKVKVNEVFKGELSDTVTVTSQRMLDLSLPGDIWIIYAYSNNDQLFVDPCGSSRSFTHPTSFNSRGARSAVPPPPAELPSELWPLYFKLYENSALQDLYYELSVLRQQKISSNTQNITIAKNLIELRLDSLDNQIQLVKWGLFVLLLLSGAIIFILFRANK